MIQRPQTKLNPLRILGEENGSSLRPANQVVKLKFGLEDRFFT